MVCHLTRGSSQGIRRELQNQKSLIFMCFHAAPLGNQHKIWPKQHNGKVSYMIAQAVQAPLRLAHSLKLF